MKENMITDVRKNANINLFAGHLLKIADEDYIAARTLYRNGFWEQFILLAQQAIEKYIKAVLLYHRVPNKKGGHDLEILIGEIEEIPVIKDFLTMADVQLDLIWSRTKPLVFKFNGAEYFKYGMGCFYYEGHQLFVLDNFVFLFRRFCKYPELHQFDMSTKIRMPRVSSGHIESVRSKKKPFNQYKNLRWKNRYIYKRKIPIYYNNFFRSKNSPLFIHNNNPNEMYECLKPLIYFPKLIKRHFK